MKSLLLSNCKFIEEIVESTKPIIDYDMYVMDENLYRIAGTGVYEQYVGFTLPPGCASDYVLKSGEPVIIYDPLENSVCLQCKVRKLCFKEHMIIYPLKHEGRTIGTIGIGAFTEDKKEKIKNMEEKLCAYLNNLCGLISAKVKETIYSERLKTIVDSLDESVLLTDYEGNILLRNDAAASMLRDIDKDCPNVFNIISKETLKNLYVKNEAQRDVELAIKGLADDKRIYASLIPIASQDEKSEKVLIFKDHKTVTDMAYRLVADFSHYPIDIEFIKGSSELLNSAKAMALSAAKCDSNVLISGESGTGKELFARAIHQMSIRNNKPFIAVNCAAIPENLMESELFGYEDGAFTGAKKGGKPGKFELANEGTLFLDEIGDLSLHLQPKLLRAIEYGQIERVGGIKSIKLDVRIVAATNRNLEKMMINGEFREDLFYRLNVIPLNISPLRIRPEDILILARFFLNTYSNKFRKYIKGFEHEAERALLMYGWPGNVRELENAIEYAINIELTDTIKYESLPLRIRNLVENNNKRKAESLKEVEMNTIIGAISKYGNTLEGKEMAAKELGISLSTLYRRLREMNKGI